MTISTSKLAYGDCYDLFDQALEDEKGIRAKVEDMDAAIFLRMRMNQARKLDRQSNLETYEPGDPMYGRSNYDRLTFRIRTMPDRSVWILLERTASNILEVASIGEADAKASE